MIRSILQVPDLRLREIAREVPAVWLDEHREAIRDLADTFAMTPNCIGLSAPQISAPWRVIVVDTSRARRDRFVMVNPVITKASRETQSVRDGCMSIDHGQTFGNTRRPKRIVVEWLDASAVSQRMGFNGLLAAAIHHEIDHLNGVLYTDHVETLQKGAQ
jgi:peptide deformylase